MVGGHLASLSARHNEVLPTWVSFSVNGGHPKVGLRDTEPVPWSTGLPPLSSPLPSPPLTYSLLAPYPLHLYLYLPRASLGSLWSTPHPATATGTLLKTA